MNVHKYLCGDYPREALIVRDEAPIDRRIMEDVRKTTSTNGEKAIDEISEIFFTGLKRFIMSDIKADKPVYTEVVEDELDYPASVLNCLSELSKQNEELEICDLKSLILSAGVDQQ